MPNNSLLKQFSKSLDAREKGVRVKKKRTLLCLEVLFCLDYRSIVLICFVAMRSEAYKLWSSTHLFITVLSP